ncbi:hypothetical protein [Thermococcus sp.]|uniref:hypothetical protein n=1 Tax=Thermococcus sp. TaxID=35749 RepID=UPI00262502F7|nr:hypothetical protein [Thermococcus sp.]
MIEMLLAVVTLILSLLLAGISYVAYKKSHLRPALYLLIAFLLFALKKTIDALTMAQWIKRDVGGITAALEMLVLFLLLLSFWKR